MKSCEMKSCKMKNQYSCIENNIVYTKVVYLLSKEKSKKIMSCKTKKNNIHEEIISLDGDFIKMPVYYNTDNDAYCKTFHGEENDFGGYHQYNLINHTVIRKYYIIDNNIYRMIKAAS